MCVWNMILALLNTKQKSIRAAFPYIHIIFWLVFSNTKITIVSWWNVDIIWCPRELKERIDLSDCFLLICKVSLSFLFVANVLSQVIIHLLMLPGYVLAQKILILYVCGSSFQLSPCYPNLRPPAHQPTLTAYWRQEGPVVKNRGPGTRRLGSSASSAPYSMLWPWASFLILLRLGF